MVIDVGGEAVNLKLLLTNSTVNGLDTITLNKITLVFKNVTTAVAINLKNLFREFPRDPKLMPKFELMGFTPLVSITGTYKASGKVLLLPLHGDGYVELKLCKCNFHFNFDTFFFINVSSSQYYF